MFPFQMDEGILIPLAAMAIPIVAITGGLVAGIVKTVGRQRTIELAQRERIAAIERGIDPAKLPPIDLGRDDTESLIAYDRYGTPLRRAHGLLIGGLVTLFSGIGIAMFLNILKPSDGGEKVWAVGLIPAFAGLALLISAVIVWPRGGNSRTGNSPQ